MIAVLRFGRFGFLAAAFLLLVINEFSRIIRIQLLLKVKKIFFSPTQLAKIYFISMFFGNFFPSSLGSDVARLLFLKRAKPEISGLALSSVILADRLIGLAGLGLLFLVGLGLAFDPFAILVGTINQSIQPIWWGLGLLGGLAVLAAVGQKLKTIFWNLLHEIKIFIHHRRVIFITFSWAIVYQLLVSLVFYFIYLGLTHTAAVPATVFLLWIPVITLISLIPISIGGLGLREWSFVFLFLPLGVPRAELVAVSLTFFVFMLIQSVFGGVLFLLTKTKN
jgi:hypothetical protein